MRCFFCGFRCHPEKAKICFEVGILEITVSGYHSVRKYGKGLKTPAQVNLLLVVVVLAKTFEEDPGGSKAGESGYKIINTRKFDHSWVKSLS